MDRINDPITGAIFVFNRLTSFYQVSDTGKGFTDLDRARWQIPKRKLRFHLVALIAFHSGLGIPIGSSPRIRRPLSEPQRTVVNSISRTSLQFNDLTSTRNSVTLLVS